MGPKGLKYHIFQTKRARMLFFRPNPPITGQLSSFKPFSDNSRDWLPKILGPMGAKKWPHQIILTGLWSTFSYFNYFGMVLPKQTIVS